MFKVLGRVGLVVTLVAVAGVAFAAPQPRDPPHDGSHQSHGQSRHDNSNWQQRQAVQRQQERNQEWQRQQREIQHRQVEQQRREAAAQQRRNAAWQRQQLAEQRRQLAEQRRQAHWQDRHSRWQRGHRYTGGSYVVVNNYSHYHLRRPPRGYRWVRADNEYLLIATATQLILDIANR